MEGKTELKMRQYLIKEYGGEITSTDEVFCATKRVFYSVMHKLTEYMSRPLDYSRIFSLAGYFIEDLEKNDPELVMEYALYALEHDEKHAIHPIPYVWLLVSLYWNKKRRVVGKELLCFTEKVLKKLKIKPPYKCIIHKTSNGLTYSVNICEEIYDDLIAPSIRQNEGRVPNDCKIIKKITAAFSKKKRKRKGKNIIQNLA